MEYNDEYSDSSDEDYKREVREYFKLLAGQHSWKSKSWIFQVASHRLRDSQHSYSLYAWVLMIIVSSWYNLDSLNQSKLLWLHVTCRSLTRKGRVIAIAMRRQPPQWFLIQWARVTMRGCCSCLKNLVIIIVFIKWERGKLSRRAWYWCYVDVNGHLKRIVTESISVSSCSVLL